MSLNKLRLKFSRRAILIVFDIICFLIIDSAYYIATRLLEESTAYDLIPYVWNSLALLGFIMLVRLATCIYFNVWRYTNTNTYMKMIVADAIGTLAAMVFTYAIGHHFADSVWHFATVASFNVLLVLMSRFAYRQLYKHINQSEESERHKIPVAIVGAGQIGALLAEELTYSKKSNYKPVFFIDKDASKVGGLVAGLKVYREDEHLLDFIQKQEVSEIFIALPKLTSEEASKVYEFYSQTDCKVKLYDTPMKETEDSDMIHRGRLREFQIEDLLFRKSLQINNTDSFRYYEGKVVLVTGGGGSIGSELCRQIAKCNPAKLVIVDIYENNAYDIQQELIRTYGQKLDLSVEIASVRDRARLDSIFDAYRPNIVFHAAAHKHVPLMEHSGCEAIKNNVIGTYNTADMAEKYQVEKFILISTDKAVNPTNIMGASKRMCEMIVQCRGDSKTSFAAVRFGNVLGSNGSVIPLFKRQIANGGPVTITDRRIIRYFMTSPEASQLVIQAGAMAKKGELFVLDMGKPVKIYDLAYNMIKLSGLEPEVDIQIEEIGLRPGEKLYEELLMKTETLTKTENDMIFIEKDTPLTRKEVDEKIAVLKVAVSEGSSEISSAKVKAALRQVVPTFHSAKSVNCNAEESEEMKEANAPEPEVVEAT